MDEKRSFAMQITRIVQILLLTTVIGILIKYYLPERNLFPNITVSEGITLGLGLLGMGIVHWLYSETLAYLYNLPRLQLIPVSPDVLRIIGLVMGLIGLSLTIVILLSFT